MHGYIKKMVSRAAVKNANGPKLGKLQRKIVANFRAEDLSRTIKKKFDRDKFLGSNFQPSYQQRFSLL